MQYYTYAYLREDRTPYYIGKGKGGRVYSNKGRTAFPPKDKSRILILKQNITEEEAFKHEIYMIAMFGRKDVETGILYNKTDGGEGVSGYVHTEYARLQSASCKNTKYWNNGIKNIRRKYHPGEGWVEGKLNNTNNSFRKNIYWWNNGVEIKPSKECPGEGWVRGCGKLHHNAAEGKQWWNNGKETKLCKECPGINWKIGRISGGTKGMKWWNNGIKNTMAKECPGKGWMEGCIKNT
jgi:hypothetical protein